MPNCYTITKDNEKKPKRVFFQFEHAILYAKNLNSKKDRKDKLVGYKCETCGKYHVGRNGKKLTKKEREKSKTYVFNYMSKSK